MRWFSRDVLRYIPGSLQRTRTRETTLLHDVNWCVQLNLLDFSAAKFLYVESSVNTAEAAGHLSIYIWALQVFLGLALPSTLEDSKPVAVW